MAKFKADEVGALAFIIAVAVALISGGYGWINNIIELAHSSFSPLSGLVVLRCIGIFLAPLGAILGYV